MKLDGIHIDFGVGDFGKDGRGLPVGYDFCANTPQAALLLEEVGVFHHETAASVIEQPGHLHITLQGIIGHPVGFEVVFLHLVHGDEQVACPGRQRKQRQQQYRQILFHRHCWREQASPND